MKQLKSNKLNFSNQDIFIGIDVHRNMWKVCIISEGLTLKTMTQPPKAKILSDYLRKNYPGGNYYSAYESGFSGYSADGELKKLGIQNILVNPADIPTNDKDRRNKNDRVDARKLSKELSKGGLKGIYIPSKESLEDRNLLRVREGIVKKQTRTKNQIKGMLYFLGIQITDEKLKSHWSRRYISWLESLKMNHESGTTAFKILIKELLDLRETLLEINKAVKKLSESDKYKEDIKNMLTVPGIGLITGMIILTELIDITRFGCFDNLNSYVGFIPSEHSSGEKEIKGNLSYRKNKRLRTIIIESSWMAIRKDPSLLQAYKKYTCRMTGSKAIIKIAKKLLNRIRYVIKEKKEYVPCIV